MTLLKILIYNKKDIKLNKSLKELAKREVSNINMEPEELVSDVENFR